ncbi:MAG TPA: hypothetical protein VFV75_11435 [Candidatus Polarisedimenticolaceae bacterium]|nr:hypothetical protein [Candidatus Polarisedimenticolaceae bacterium]
MRALLLLLVCVLAGPAVAAERTMEWTGFVGYRDGAELEGADADPAPSFGLGATWWIRRDAWFEVFYDRQRLDFDRFDLAVGYLQFGGGYEPPREGVRPYVTVAAGLGHFQADPGSVDDPVNFSGSIGGGFKLPLSRKTLFRLEARGWAILASASTAVTCGPGCSVSFRGEGWGQFGVRAAFALVP